MDSEAHIKNWIHLTPTSVMLEIKPNPTMTKQLLKKDEIKVLITSTNTLYDGLVLNGLVEDSYKGNWFIVLPIQWQGRPPRPGILTGLNVE